MMQDGLVGLIVLVAALVVLSRVLGTFRVRPRKWLAGVLLRCGQVELAMRVQHGPARTKKISKGNDCCEH